MQEQAVRSEKIKVAVRVRPFLSNEIGKENVCFVAKNGKQIRVSDLTHTVEGTYDKVFPSETSQNDAYSYVSDCIPSLLNGFNCTIFAYGQTGSGKTFSMFGEGYDSQQKQSVNGKLTNNVFKQRHSSIAEIKNIDATLENEAMLQSKRGIIPRCISELFAQIKNQTIKVTIYCSFLQIYNEKLYDLLQDTYTRNPLQIREEKIQGIYVEGLSEYVVQDENDCLNLLRRGELNRIKRSTKMNIKSSRSHTLFQLLLETDQVDGKGMLKKAKLNLGDLAGSEKVNKDEEMKAKHMLELRNINLSLTTLGKVIQVLSNGQQNPHVPFRESKLTRLLQDSIGGNCQTYLIATVSPIIDSIEETISTLKFADRAKCVMQRVKKNEINAKDDALVQKLKKEVQYLKELLQLKRQGVNPKDLSHQLYILKDENERLRQMALNYEDIEKMKQENKQMRLELQKLKMLTSDVGSHFNGDITPRSIQGIQKLINQKSSIDADSKVLNNPALDSTSKQQAQKLSDSDDSIQEQFKNYKSELNFEVKLQQHNFGRGGQSLQTDILTERSKFTLNQKNSQGASPHNFKYLDTNNIMQQNLDKVKEQLNLKAQKERLQNVITEQQQYRNLEGQQSSSFPRQKQSIIIKKRYKEEDLSDDGTSIVKNKGIINLPQINDGQINLQQNKQSVYSKVELTRKSSNVEIQQQKNYEHQKSPFTMNRSNINPLMKSTDSYLSDFTKHPQQNVINKYPNRSNQMQRRSVNEYPITSTTISQTYQNQPSNLSQIQVDINKSYQLGTASGMIGMTTQSSLYGMQLSQHNHSLYHAGMQSNTDSGNIFTQNQIGLNQTTIDHNKYREKSPLQTVVRIRGRHNKMVETKGSIMMTLDEEKHIAEKKKQLRRSNDRLRMLESMEIARKEKVEAELTKLLAGKQKREEQEIRKREIIKQRKYVNANVGITSRDNEANELVKPQTRQNQNHTINL